MAISNEHYPLELENWGEDTYLVVSLGHHDLEAFTNLVKQEYSEWGDFFESAYHGYYKQESRAGYDSWYTPCCPTTEGAIPATIAQEGWKAEFGTNTWDSLLFSYEDYIVPIHNDFGENPPLEQCCSYDVCKGETFRAKTLGDNAVWNVRIANEYRKANQKEIELKHRVND